MSEIIISADSTCDLSDELKQRYHVHCRPLHVHLENKIYRDGVDITPEMIYETFDKKKILPTTSAPNPQEYIDYFRQWTYQGHEVIHISLGSGISSSYQNAKLAAEELGNVYVIDSGNLSTGMGALVIEAAERIAEGMPANKIYEEVLALKPKANASFVVNTLTYLRGGGRCSAITAFGANLLNIKPCIKVNHKDATMTVGKKYRGSLPVVLKRYVKDLLKDRHDLDLKRLFITHSGTSQENIVLVKQTIEAIADFQEIHITRTGCTIASHCGPNTVGILYMTK